MNTGSSDGAPPAAEWEVAFSGHASDLEHLARHFTSDPVIVVRNADASYRLRAKLFENCSSSDEVLAIAEEQLLVLSGTLRLIRDSRTPLKAEAVFRTHPNRRDVFVHVRDTLQLRADAGEVTVTVTDANGVVIRKSPPPPKTLTITQLTVADPAVAKAMRLMATDAASWVGLYRLLEVIEEDLGGAREIVRAGWTSESQLKRFTHSANSVAVAGDEARHGKSPELLLQRRWLWKKPHPTSTAS